MSNIYDKASLVLIPSGTKTSKVYSQKPVSGDGDFTFSRSTMATRVNADGDIEKETQNKLLQSNDFDTTWTLTGSTLVGGQSDKDGGTDAWKLTSSNTGQSFVKQVVSSSGVATYSVYAKAGTANFIVAYAVGGGDPRTFFDLQNGTTETAAHNITNKIEDVGNGWYRCSVIFSKTITDVRFFIADSDNVFNSGNGSSIYIQDAQLEQGLVARDVITTTTSAVEGGITDNVPRLDYTDASCPSLLLEPQRLNRFAYSEYLGLYNTLNGASITTNYSESPEGYDNATRLQLAAQSQSRMETAVGTGSDVQNKRHTISCWVKSNGADTDFRLKCTHSGVLDYFSDDLVATSEWKRFTFTQLFGAGAGSAITAGILNGSSNNAADLSIYGLQLEDNASYPTSYIPTYGSAVTRNAPSLGKYDFTDSSTQTLFVEYDHTAYGSGGAEFIIEKTNPVGAIFRIYVDVDSSSNDNNKVRFRTEFPVSQFDYNTSRTRSQNQKVAFVISGTTAKAFCNGSLVKTFTITETTMEQLNYRVQNGKFRTKQLLMLPTALTDQEAIDLTTL